MLYHFVYILFKYRILYTIGKVLKQFFHFKGKTAGIDNDTHDIKMEISGNYTPQQLIDAVNTAVQDQNAIIDASIGNTYLVTTQTHHYQHYVIKTIQSIKLLFSSLKLGIVHFN